MAEPSLVPDRPDRPGVAAVHVAGSVVLAGFVIPGVVVVLARSAGGGPGETGGTGRGPTDARGRPTRDP